MMSLFLNPWTFIAGALLVSAPIIIHLINRIRFRRVKWAAMEFLLKAQKRMRRRKILEQLLLLFLRCLLVFLAGLLFSRFLGFNNGESQETRSTTHLVILDDTPSMADAWRPEGGTPTDAYTEAKKLVYEKLMPAAAEATTKQSLQVVRLSEVGKPYPAKAEDARISADSIQALKEYLEHPDRRQVSTVRKSLRDGLDAAKALAALAPADDAKIVHVVSDMRTVDWNDEVISEKLNELKDLGATVHFIDVANPARKADRKSPPFSDNLAITELTPRNRVVAVDQQIEIDVRVKNFGGIDEKDVRIEFFLNGQPNVITSIQFPSLPPNQERTLPVTVKFLQTGTREKPLDRFNLVTASIAKSEPAGLAIDNVRHAVVEVRPKLQVLVVDGRPDLRDSPRGDSFYLKKFLLQGLGGVEWVPTEPNKLEGTDLRSFSSVYLMNVPTLTLAAVANLERYVKEGGGVGVFLGPDVKPDDYTSRMYRGGTGFFPAPLPGTGPSKELTREENDRRASALGKRLFLRRDSNRGHPALSILYDDRTGKARENDIERYFLFTNIDYHWPIARGAALRDDPSVTELYCMPNEKPIREFEDRAANLSKEIKAKYNEPKFEPARKSVDLLLRRIEESMKPDEPLTSLARYMDQLLCDQINDGDPSEPILRDFWNQPEMAETKKTAQGLRDDAKFGDPLYLAKDFGRGRVTVMTTDAGGMHTGGKVWTDWPSGTGAASWVPVVLAMQGYLSGGGGESNPSLGDRFSAEFEAGRYKPSVGRHLMTADVTKAAGGKAPFIVKDLGEQPLDQPPPGTDGVARPFQLVYAEAKEPGAYIFSLTRLGVRKDEPAEQPDYAVTVFNVDAAHEGDLRRASTDDIAQRSGKAPLHNIEDLSWIDDFKQKPTDLSSRRWLYLLILLVLIAEQAWAVRISYHTKPEDLESLAPSAAAAFAHTASPTPVEVAATADADAAAAAR